MNPYNHRLPMRKKTVNRILDKIELFGEAVYHSSSFDNRIAELKSLKQKLEEQEKRLYQELGVKNITQLNEKVKNLKGLQSLGGSYLNKRLNSLIIDDNIDSANQLVLELLKSKEWEDTVNTILQNQNYSEELLPDIIEAFVKNFKNSKNITFNLPKNYKDNKNFGIKKILQNITQENGKWIIKKANNQKISGHMKKKLQIAVNVTSQSENAAQATLSLIDMNRQNYAGWKYSWESIKNDTTLITEIRKSILDMCIELIKEGGGTASEIYHFEQAFNKYPSPALLQSTIAGVQGAIGEIQLGAIISFLTNGKNSNTLQTGTFRNALANNQQISVDFLLSSFGFQVKNYNEYAYSIPRSIEIKHTKKLGTWCEELELSNMLEEMLNTFYSIRWYNIKYNEDYEDTESRILAIEEGLNKFYAQFPERILRLSEDIQVLNSAGDSILSGRFYNTFYFVSGQEFIPSSRLIQNIIDFFNNMNLAENNVKSSSSYTGYDIRDFLDKGKYESAPTMQSVYESINLTLSYRIHLTDLLKY